MRFAQFKLSRRSFLKSAGPGALAFSTIIKAQNPRSQFTEADLPEARRRLLTLVNTQRTLVGLNLLALDDLAGRVATEHAVDMARGDFLSHWGTDGAKPYHRYSFAGGTDAVQENVSAADNLQWVSTGDVLKYLHDMHNSMFSEVPPNDGHRKTILYPHHTHVGFGIAVQGHNVRLDELYLSRYVKIDPIQQHAKVRAIVPLSGKLLYRNHVLDGVEVFYEPLPSPPNIFWLKQLRSYEMPKESSHLLPRLSEGMLYADGSSGSIQIENRMFRVRVPMSKKPGINTLMLWIKNGVNGTAFPATQVCVRVE
jgi:uncharacterized protein YkwD